MKKLLQNTLKPLFALAIIIAAITLSSCNKDETCGVRINVLDSNGVKQQYMWVVLDWAPGVPAGQKSPAYPIRLNTRKEGFVECTIPLPGIPYAYVYDSANYQLTPGTELKAAPIKLIPGETVPIDITIN